MSFAGSADVAALLGRSLTSVEDAQAGALLDAAELLLRQRITDIVDRALADELTFSLVCLVEAKAARRVLMNPSGARQRSETVDDYTQSETLDVAVSTGDIYISDDEWQLLGAGSSSAGSFSMSRGYL